MTYEALRWRVDALNGEWARLAVLPAPAGWSGFLVGVGAGGGSTLGEVLDAVPAASDAVLGGLLAACAEGDALAGRVVVQAMLGKLVKMATRDGEHDLGAYVAALWEVVRAYPLGRRPHKVAANLALDTLKAVKRGGRRLPVVVTDAVPTPAPRDPDPGGDRVLRAAVRLGLIDDETRELLSVVYVDGRDRREVASARGITQEALRARCSRAVRALRAGAGQLASAVA